MGEASRRSRRADLVLGVLLGLLLGLAVITAFVFLGSEDTIDAPRVSAPGEGRSAAPAPDRAGPRP